MASVISLVVLLLVTHLCDITYLHPPPPPLISSHAFKVAPPRFEHSLVLLTFLTGGEGGGEGTGDCEHKIMEMLFIPIRSQVFLQLLVAGFSKIVMTFSSRKRLP